MNCPNCGFLLPDDSKFCQYCGTVLSGNVPGSEPAHAPAAPETFSPDAAPPAPAAPDYTAPPAAQAAASIAAASAYPAAPMAQIAAAPPTPAVPAASAAPACTASPSAQAAAAFLAAAPSQAAVPSQTAAPGTRHTGGAARHTRKGEKIKKCKACGAQIDPRTRRCTGCGRSASRISPTALALTVVSVLLVCSLAGNLFQYGFAAQLQQKLEQERESGNAAIAALENQLSETEAERQRLNAQLVSANTKLEQTQKEAHYFDSIRSFLASSDAGYASDQFFASKSVLILRLADEPQTFSLTSLFSSGGKYFYDVSSSCVSVSFPEGLWYDTTTARVAPRTTGTSYITFSNSLNSQTFRVLVIVTE